MKLLATILMSAAVASTAIAGPIVSKNPKAPVMPPPPAGCQCFAPGASFGFFGGAILPDSGDDELGGGILGEYFFTENIGIQGTYGLYATESEHHQFDASLVLRAPIKSLCIAPYALVGGGFSSNSENEGSFHVGGGLDVRLESWNCAGIFADGVYHFAEDDDRDHTIVRLGVKIPF